LNGLANRFEPTERAKDPQQVMQQSQQQPQQPQQPQQQPQNLQQQVQYGNYRDAGDRIYNQPQELLNLSENQAKTLAQEYVKIDANQAANIATKLEEEDYNTNSVAQAYARALVDSPQPAQDTKDQLKTDFDLK